GDFGRRRHDGTLVSAKKALEHHQRPEDRSVVTPSIAMLVENPPEERRVEQAALGERTALHRLGNAPRERRAKPDVDGHSEAHLLSVQHLSRKNRLERSFQNVLAFAAAELESS